MCSVSSCPSVEAINERMKMKATSFRSTKAFGSWHVKYEMYEVKDDKVITHAVD